MNEPPFYLCRLIPCTGANHTQMMPFMSIAGLETVGRALSLPLPLFTADIPPLNVVAECPNSWKVKISVKNQSLRLVEDVHVATLSSWMSFLRGFSLSIF